MRHNTKIRARLSRTRLMATTALVVGFVAGQAAAQAVAPSGGHVVSGTASINSAGATTTITQSSGKAIIDWTGFSIGQGQTVQFDNGTGATLNRVTGGNLSSIDGQLSATGSVYLINPNGVIIGKTGVVRTGGTFAASTLDVSDADFLKGGDLTFDGLSGAAVINLGQVGSLGGNVAFMAGTVENDGSVSAPGGTAGLLAGHSILMRDQSVDGGTFAVLSGGADTSVTHKGAIAAAAVELRVADGNIYALAGNTQGFINATGVGTVGGKVWLTAGDGGSVTASGRITTVQASGDGGTVETSGGTVDFTGLQVDTTGATGKTGTWLVDPYDLTIDSAAAATISGNLATTNVILQTTNTGTSGPGTANSAGVGDIDINSAIAWSSGNTLTLDAYHGINIDAGITVSGAGKVVLTTNDGGTGGDYSFGLGPTGFAGSLDYTGSGGALTINGSNYTLVTSMAGLASLNHRNANYALATSLDAGGTTYFNALVASFGGTFTGLGHTISGLTITNSSGDIALFDDSTGILRDLGFVGGQLRTTGNGSAALVVTQSGGAILNVYSSATVTGAYYAGGLVAYDTGTISNAYTTGAVSGTLWTGGLVGYLNGRVTNAYATGAVSGLNYTGGLAGLADSGTVITESFATGLVVGDGIAGGLVGELIGGTVSTSYATGAVNASGPTGGLVGGIIGGGTVTTSYATGAVIAASLSSGGLIGGLSGGTVTSSYATGFVFGHYTVGGAIGIIQVDNTYPNTITSVYYDRLTSGLSDSGKGIGETTAQLQSGTLPSGFSSPAWATAPGLYPYLTAFYSSTPQAVTGYVSTGGTGLAGAGVELYTNGHFLGAASTGYNGYYYALLPSGTLTSSTHLGEILIGPTPTEIAGAAYTDTPLAGVNIVMDSFTIATADTAYGNLVSDLGNAFGTSTYASLSSSLDDSALVISASGSFAFNGTLNRAGSVTIDAAGGNLSLQAGSSITSAETGDAIVLAANGNLINSAGSAALSASDGSWVIYSQAPGNASALPTGDSFGGLSGTNYYNDAFNFSTATFASTPGGGNRFVYGYAPTLTIIPTTKSATYTGAVQTDTYSVTGYLSAADENADHLSGVSLETSSKNVGTYTPTATGSAASSENYLINYGSGTFTITPAALTLAAIADTKTYDATTASSGTVSVSGLKGSDTVTGTTQAFDSQNAGSRTLSVSGYTVNDGNSGGNYTVTTRTASGTIDKAVLTLAATTDSKTYDATTHSSGMVSVTGLKGRDAVTGDTQAFTSKNVLGTNGSTLAVNSGYAVNDGNGGNNYTVTTQTASGTINKAALTLAAVTDTKTYDATTTSTGTVSVSGLKGSDTVTGAAQAFDSQNAGSRTLGVSGYIVNDGNSGNNYAVTTQTASGAINKAALTLAAVTDTKTYDATKTSTGTVSISGLKGSDTVTGATQAFDSQNAGSRTLGVSGYTINDGNSGGNYTVTTQTASGTINKAALTLAAVTDTKTYDATKTSTGTVSISGLKGSDTVTGATQSFDSKNAGTRTLSVNGYAVNDGNGGGNYTVTTQTASGTIDKAALTLAATSDAKTYDATTTSTGTVSVSGLKGADTVTGASQAFDSKNAGARTLSVGGYAVNDGNGGGNYTVTTQTASGTINKAALTLAAITDTKTYDATTTSTGTVSVSGLKGSDTVSGASQSFTSPNVLGTGGSTLAVNGGYAINDGNGGGNYTVSTRTAAGTITPAPLTSTGLTWSVADARSTYGVTAILGAATLNGVLSSDSGAVSGIVNAFSGATQVTLTNKTPVGTYLEEVTGLTGSAAGNYYLLGTGNTNGTLTITPALLTAALVGSTSKTYDGTTGAALLSSNYSLSGVIAGDTVALNDPASGAYADKNAGSGKVVSVSGLALSGADAGNYALDATTASAAIGTINQAALTLAATTDTKTYDATTASTGTVSVSGLKGGDTVTGAAQTFDSRNAGSRTLSVSGYTVNDGNGGGNYTVSIQTASGTIDKAALTLAATTDTKTYDATTTSTGTVGVTGLKGSDTVTGTSQSFDSQNAGSRTLAVNSGYTVKDGNGGGNYTVSTQTASGTIDKAALTLAAATDTKTYDATTASTGMVGVKGLKGADTVTGTSQSFDSQNAGSRTLAVNSGYTVNDGNDGGNYTVSTQTASGTINKAALTLAAATDTKTYDATKTSTGTVSVAGLKGSDTVTGTSQSFDSQNAGSRTLSVSGYTVDDGNGGGNYDVATQTATGSITPAALTLAATSDTRAYDATTTSAGSVRISGLKGSDTVTGASQSFDDRNAGSRTLAVNGGYTVNDGNGGRNYTIATQTATGAITPAALTLAATDESKAAGQADPALTYAITGGTLFGTDRLTGNLTRAPGETVGAYAITQGSLTASANYDVTFKPGVFTITNLALQNSGTPHTPATGPSVPLADVQAPASSGLPGAVAPTCFTTQDGDCVNTPYPDNTTISASISYEAH